MKKLTISVGVTTMIAVMQAVVSAADKKAASAGDVAAVGGGLAILALPVLAIYLIPAIIGFIRKKDNKMAILLLNLFLGWSMIGWVVALVWAVSKDKQPQTIIINNGPGNQSN
ncbi:MAG: superinfection immunity protein [Geobacter sp.]|nr:superinfection immunity protein [Geobacter sp.]